MPAGSSHPCASHWWKGYRAIAAIGKSMVTRISDWNFVPLCTMELEGNRTGRRTRAANPVSRGVRRLVYGFALALRLVRDRSGRTDGMEEKRKYPRTELDEPAYVSSGGSVMSCVVRNISREGAAIDVDNPAFVPHHFRLVMAKDPSTVHECRVAWIHRRIVSA
jgi:hypothetical protein